MISHFLYKKLSIFFELAGFSYKTRCKFYKKLLYLPMNSFRLFSPIFQFNKSRLTETCDDYLISNFFICNTKIHFLYRSDDSKEIDPLVLKILFYFCRLFSSTLSYCSFHWQFIVFCRFFFFCRNIQKWLPLFLV